MENEIQKQKALELLKQIIPVPATKRDLLVETCLQQVGTCEDQGNQVKYNFWFYGRPVRDGDRGPGYKYPWCCTFVCWCFNQIGKKLPRADYSNGWSSVPNLYQYAENRRMLTTDPRMGDLVIMAWDGGIKHIGVFVKWVEPGKTFLSVEGNTAFDEKGSQDNGGAVAMKSRNMHLVKGFVNVDNFLQ